MSILLIDNYKKLEVGQCFKNYGALQTFLGEPFKQGGKSRQLQLEDWQRYFDFSKEGHKYTITDVYENPTPKIDHRGETSNRAIYSKHIEILILDMLQHTKSGNWTGNKNQLYTELGLVGKNYQKYHYIEESKRDLIMRFQEITQWELKQFYQRADNKLHSIVISALKSMADKSLIKLEEKIYIRPRYGLTYIADSADKKAILRTENEVLEEMGYETKSQVFLAHKMDLFYSKVKENLDVLYDWVNHYRLIQIISNKDRNEIALTKVKKEFEKMCLNHKFHDYMNDNAEKEYQRMLNNSYKDYQKALETKEFLHEISQDEYTKIDANRAKVFYPPSKYVDAQHLIGNITIPLDTDRINDEYFMDYGDYSDIELAW